MARNGDRLQREKSNLPNFSKPLSSARSTRYRRHSSPINFSKPLSHENYNDHQYKQPAFEQSPSSANFSRPFATPQDRFSSQASRPLVNFSKPLGIRPERCYRRYVSEPASCRTNARAQGQYQTTNFSVVLGNQPVEPRELGPLEGWNAGEQLASTSEINENREEPGSRAVNSSDNADSSTAKSSPPSISPNTTRPPSRMGEINQTESGVLSSTQQGTPEISKAPTKRTVSSYANIRPQARRSSWPLSSYHPRKNRPIFAGVEQRDFAFDQPTRTPKIGKNEDGGELDDVSATRAGNTSRPASPMDTTEPRRSSWVSIVGIRRRFSTASLPANVGRRISDTMEAIFGSERCRSVFAKMTEGVFSPTAAEAAHYYHTPSVAAFNVDLESGEDQPEGPVDPARSLTKKELLYQRLFFGSIVFCLNITCIVVSGTGHSGTWVLCCILFFKSKDFLSVWVQIFGRLYLKIKPLFISPAVRKKAAWILSLIPAYSESEEQIVKTLFSLRDNGTGEHQQVMCVILDGKPRPIKSHMTKVVASFERPYVSLKWKIGKLTVDAGFVDNIPTLCIEKSPNAGKKDSLILCHDLFNYPRSNMDQGVRNLRDEIWTAILPQLTQIEDFKGFDLVFCTDADSTIHQGALALLADACLDDPNSIAACGFVYVEYEPGLEWSAWNLYQQFQYSFGQIVRRGAEHFWGKVTCLPGCITMIVVRPEMAGAIEKYARPVTSFPVLRHQVQYLGTDRRLTYSMLSQGRHLHTLFVPGAGSETVAPQSLKHYLSQRRRWGSNAYFNNYFYLAGENMIWITRLAATIEVSRLTMVYYRVFNTALFLYGVAKNFNIIKLLPLILISFTPSIWFLVACTFLNSHLRANGLKLFCGFCINRCISPFMSITVFSLVARNLGSQVWGISGVTAGANVTAEVAAQVITEKAQEPPEQKEVEIEGEAEVEVLA